MDSETRKGADQTFSQFTRLIKQVREGSAAAEDELFRRIRERLEAMIRAMLRQNPRVARWQQTGDLYGELWLKLRSMLRTEPINDRSHFFRIANLAMRRILCDFARSYRGPQTFEGRYQTAHRDGQAESRSPKPLNHNVYARLGGTAPPGPVTSAIIKEDHFLIHTLLERLEDDEFELVALIYFQELSQEESAEVLGIDERTVRRRLPWIVVRLGQLAER